MDEHVWRLSRHGPDRAVTAMVDLTRDQRGCLRARLLDVVPGRSGTAYAAWLRERPPEFTAGEEHAALDPFRGYANAIRDELPDTVAVLDAFHVVRLGTAVVDEVRRRVQQHTFGHRGHKHDPLYKIRGLLRHGAEHLSPRHSAGRRSGRRRPELGLTVAWHCYQQLRSIYHARSPAEGRRIAERVIASFPTCPIVEVARLGRTLRAWRAQILAYFDTAGVSNGGTEAINLLIEKTRRLAGRWWDCAAGQDAGDLRLYPRRGREGSVVTKESAGSRRESFRLAVALNKVGGDRDEDLRSLRDH